MLNFLYTAISWVLLRWYELFTALGMSKESGVTWALSIVMLVVTARVVLFRFFIKQVHYTRKMQEMQPRLKAIQEKYKNDRAAQQREIMALQQAEGFNPLSGCLPILLQFVIMLPLFHVLRHLANSAHLPLSDPKMSLYGFTPQQTYDAAHAKLWGAPLAAALRDSTAMIEQLGGNPTSTRIVIIILVLISAAATFITQQLVMSRATTQPVGTAATVQKLMKYFIPVSVLGSGLFFQLGVLIYWFTSNTWTLGQQIYINKYHPHTPVEAKPAGELGKTLAPPPGAKPINPARGKRPSTSASDSVEDAADNNVQKTPEADSAPPPPSGAPRPGARPNRPARSGQRPSGQRPSQAKKRR